MQVTALNKLVYQKQNIDKNTILACISIFHI